MNENDLKAIKTTVSAIVLSGLVSQPDQKHSEDLIPHTVASSIKYADELLKQLDLRPNNDDEYISKEKVYKKRPRRKKDISTRC